MAIGPPPRHPKLQKIGRAIASLYYRPHRPAEYVMTEEFVINPVTGQPEKDRFGNFQRTLKPTHALLVSEREARVNKWAVGITIALALGFGAKQCAGRGIDVAKEGLTSGSVPSLGDNSDSGNSPVIPDLEADPIVNQARTLIDMIGKDSALSGELSGFTGAYLRLDDGVTKPTFVYLSTKDPDAAVKKIVEYANINGYSAFTSDDSVVGVKSSNTLQQLQNYQRVIITAIEGKFDPTDLAELKGTGVNVDAVALIQALAVQARQANELGEWATYISLEVSQGATGTIRVAFPEGVDLGPSTQELMTSIQSASKNIFPGAPVWAQPENRDLLAQAKLTGEVVDLAGSPQIIPAVSIYDARSGVLALHRGIEARTPLA